VRIAKEEARVVVQSYVANLPKCETLVSVRTSAYFRHGKLEIVFLASREANMALPDDIFVSDDNPAVPGGNITKPLVVALLAYLASRYFGSSQVEETAPTTDSAPRPSEPQPSSTADPSPGSILDGLGGLIEQFQKKGFGETIDSWIKTGPNKEVASRDVSDALGGDLIDQLSRRTGLSRDQILNELSRMLPKVVDGLTPQGRLPTRQELTRLMG
jgi:uncharacterized protein YidB (DUF937 family)